MGTGMFECKCGQIARSQFAYDGHPRSRDCGDRVPVKAELEARPETKESSPSITKYERIDPREEWK